MVRSQRRTRLAKGAAKDVAVVAPDQEVERVNGSAGSARLAVPLLRWLRRTRWATAALFQNFLSDLDHDSPTVRRDAILPVLCIFR